MSSSWQMEMSLGQLCMTLCDPMDCNLPGFSVHGIFQAIVVEWVTISFPRGSSQPRDRTRVSCIEGSRQILNRIEKGHVTEQRDRQADGITTLSLKTGDGTWAKKYRESSSERPGSEFSPRSSGRSMMLLTPSFQLGDVYFIVLSFTTMTETGSRNRHVSGKIKEIKLQF